MKTLDMSTGNHYLCGFCFFRVSFVGFVFCVTINGYISTFFSYYALTLYEELNFVYIFFLFLMGFYLIVATYLSGYLVSQRPTDLHRESIEIQISEKPPTLLSQTHDPHMTKCSFFQVFGILMNITTNEQLKYKKYAHMKDKDGKFFNPFNGGPKRNFLDFFFIKLLPRNEDGDYIFTRLPSWLRTCRIKFDIYASWTVMIFLMSFQENLIFIINLSIFLSFVKI